MSGRGTPALEALRAAGIAHAVHAYEAPAPAARRDRDRRPQYGLDAAAALGLDPARVFKTDEEEHDAGEEGAEAAPEVVPAAGEEAVRVRRARRAPPRHRPRSPARP